MADPNVGQRQASTWESYVGKTPEDNIHDDYWLQRKMKELGGYKSLDGGRVVNATLEYALNPNVAWVGEDDTLSTIRPNVFDEATYNLKILAGTTTFNEFEKAINQGSAQKFDLQDARMENLRQTMFSNINSMLLGAASGNQPGGLQDLVPTDPTTGTVGGINRAVFTFWRSQQTSGAKTTTAFDNLRSTWTSIYNLCSNGVSGKHPQIVVTTRTVFQGFEGLLIANDRYIRESAGDKANANYESDALAFKGAQVSYDNDCASGVAYFLNFAHFKLAYPKGFWMKAFPAVDPANQLGDVFKVMTVCVPIVNNSRRLGVVTAIT